MALNTVAGKAARSNLRVIFIWFMPSPGWKVNFRLGSMSGLPPAMIPMRVGSTGKVLSMVILSGVLTNLRTCLMRSQKFLAPTSMQTHEAEGIIPKTMILTS